MSKNSKNSSIPTMWKRVPHRIKGLLKRDKFDPTSPPPPYSKATPFISRIFTSQNKNKKHTKLKSKQWKNHNNNEVHVSELDFTEVPLRANMMSIFNPHQQSGWSSLLSASNKSLDVVSRVYLSTLAKVRSLGHYNLEQQVSIHHMLNYIQSRNQKDLRNFNSILSNRFCDAILMNNRKPRRTRYIFMLLSTPSSHVVDKLHPVTEALSKLRKPYAETVTVITSDMLKEHEKENEEKTMKPAVEEEKIIKFDKMDPLSHVVAYKFVPADYLLDPATLRGPDVPHHRRLGTKFNSSTDQKEQQQQQQQQQPLYNKESVLSSIAPIMARIQIQTN